MSELEDAVTELLASTDPLPTALELRGESIAHLDELWHKLARLVNYQRNPESDE